MRNWLDKTALRWAYKLIYFTLPMFGDVNNDAKLQGILRSLEDVYADRYLTGKARW